MSHLTAHLSRSPYAVRLDGSKEAVLNEMEKMVPGVPTFVKGRTRIDPYERTVYVNLNHVILLVEE